MDWLKMSDKEKDALVAERVMGWTDVTMIDSRYFTALVGQPPDRSVLDGMPTVPLFTVDLVAAMQIIEHMHAAGFLVLLFYDIADETPWGCAMTRLLTTESWEYNAATFAEAVCVTALWACDVAVEA